MREESVEFFSEGVRVAGILRLPDQGDGPFPAIVQGPGWLGLADAKAYVPWHAAFVAAGFAVLVFDYRGYGRSDGERGWILPERMVEDMINAVTFLETRPDIDPRRIGGFGMGGIGSASIVVAAARDERIRALAIQSVVSDGEAWLRGMRREYEWVEYKARVAADARIYATTGESELVDPRADIMVGAPERARYTGKADVDAKIEQRFHLQSAAAVMRCRPLDVVDSLAGRGILVITVVDDTVTPEEQGLALYERASAPKKLVRQHGTTHYESYTTNFDVLCREIVDWYDEHLTDELIEIAEEPA